VTHNDERPPYSVFARFYDELTGAAWSARAPIIATAINGIERRTGRGLDLACGTGAGAAWLVCQGFDVVGIDSSKPMLDVARGRVPAARFLHGDLRALPSLPAADLAICCFDSINYLLDPKDWPSAFSSVRAALTAGGRFVFDVVTPFDHRENWHWHRDVVERDDFVFASRGEYDPNSGVATVRNQFFVREADVWRRHIEVHKQVAFHQDAIFRWLSDAGFARVRLLDGDTGVSPSAQSVRWMFVADAATP